jgi:DNA-nicking Smr family endonuclease
MSNKDNSNIFLKSLEGVKPLKKNNKIIKPIPKSIKSNSPRTIIKEVEDNKIYERAKDVTSQKKTLIQKSGINKKLKKNKIPIDKKIDFHGCSLNDAKKIFFDTINDCFLNSFRCILFITGKGSVRKTNNNSQETKLYYGKIRSNFLSWVHHKAAQSKILNVQQANINSGGDGAFFVYLRKNKN